MAISNISDLDREVDGIIRKHHVYGAECVINALVRAARKEPHLDREDLHKMIDAAYRREEEHK